MSNLNISERSLVHLGCTVFYSMKRKCNPWKCRSEPRLWARRYTESKQCHCHRFHHSWAHLQSQCGFENKLWPSGHVQDSNQTQHTNCWMNPFTGSTTIEPHTSIQQAVFQGHLGTLKCMPVLTHNASPRRVNPKSRPRLQVRLQYTGQQAAPCQSPLFSYQTI